MRAVVEAGIDKEDRTRVVANSDQVGALWHIYRAQDADQIRDFLNKVDAERGNKKEPHHDPIHDQSWYLDGVLRRRLHCEYGVEAYSFIQFSGDAVFIPAGAPHQVN